MIAPCTQEDLLVEVESSVKFWGWNEDGNCEGSWGFSWFVMIEVHAKDCFDHWLFPGHWTPDC
jgi:hypothetical protein